MTQQEKAEVRKLIRDELAVLIGYERLLFQKDIIIRDGHTIQIGSDTGTKIGTATGQKIALHGATPVIQAAHIANPSGAGDAGVDTPARTAINSILVVLENKGLTATS